MFSGIVEASSKIAKTLDGMGILRIVVDKPNDFNDLRPGDSVAVNGVCLTVELVDQEGIQFALAAETLQVTGWTAKFLKGTSVNLERSLRIGDRNHGHFVSGHVDGSLRLLSIEKLDECEIWELELPQSYADHIWAKGSIALNGVSLTVNTVVNDRFSVCLIPETLKRTNLGLCKEGDLLNFEVDTFARGLVHWLSNRRDQEQPL